MPFKPGQSGNPNGRPKNPWSITDAMREYLRKHPDYKRKFVEKAVSMALAGDTKAMQLVWNYMNGMPNQQVDLNGDMKNTIESSSLDKLADSIKSIMEAK